MPGTGARRSEQSCARSAPPAGTERWRAGRVQGKLWPGSGFRDFCRVCARAWGALGARAAFEQPPALAWPATCVRVCRCARPAKIRPCPALPALSPAVDPPAPPVLPAPPVQSSGCQSTQPGATRCEPPTRPYLQLGHCLLLHPQHDGVAAAHPHRQRALAHSLQSVLHLRRGASISAPLASSRSEGPLRKGCWALGAGQCRAGGPAGLGLGRCKESSAAPAPGTGGRLGRRL